MTETPEHAPAYSQQPCLDHLSLCHWSLFRISDFVIRIYLAKPVACAYRKYIQCNSDNKRYAPTQRALLPARCI